MKALRRVERAGEHDRLAFIIQQALELCTQQANTAQKKKLKKTENHSITLFSFMRIAPKLSLLWD